jgi:hypothetical protein
VLKVLFVLIIIAVATYALVRVIQRRGVTTPVKGPLRGPLKGPLAGMRDNNRSSGPVGPDDDEEFLRDLDRKRLNGDGQDG